MSHETERHEITRKRVVLSLPGTDDVLVRRDLTYLATADGNQTLDLYYPPAATAGAQTPAVILVPGYSDVGFQKMLGCRQNEMESYISWGKLIAASGLIAVTCTTAAPATDIQALVQYLRQNAAGLGIDEHRLGLWACSGSVPNAFSLLFEEDIDYLKCAVFCYGFMPEGEGMTITADAARQWGFVYHCAGRSVSELPPNLPLLIVRAGRDETPHINETIDGFVKEALCHNLPVTLINHATAPHAFDLMDDSRMTRAVIRQILSFLRSHLPARNAQ